MKNLSSRVITILAVLLLALYMIFPKPQKLFDPNLRFWEKTNLKPGIDMVGGTSLTYEIRPAPGSIATADLAIKTMEALKKRVDPDGIRNLIWRPQGATRLEVQMPLSDYSGQNKKIRENYSNAQRALEATNASTSDVIAAIETMKGDDRAARLKQLADGSDAREKLYGALRGAFDQVQDAKAKNNLDAAARAEIQYEDLQKQVGLDNLTVGQMQDAMSADPAEQQKKVDALKATAVGFTARSQAIDNYVAAYAAYDKVKGQLDDSADLKRLLHGSGVLEFHILVPDSMSADPVVQTMEERLLQRGPLPQANDTMRWYVFDKDSNAHGGIVRRYNDHLWALAWITPQDSMIHRDGPDQWALENAMIQNDPNGGRAVGFQFDLVGARLFTKLTRQENIGHTLGAILDDRIISAATLQSTIGRNGQITMGDSASQDDVDYLVNTLSAGSLPAQLADEPISERTVGPQLGLDNLKSGLLACGLGLIIVCIFLVSYYYLAGVVAFIAVAMNVVLIFGVMAMFGATFTLPGIAGIVLTIGAAVDANVLIFERLREEQQRGLSLKLALDHAYGRALSAIVDSNMTTVITSIVLIWLSSEEVKGFGITLLIGLVASLFTSLFVTRTIFMILVDKFGIKKLGSFPLTVPAWNRLLHPSIDWMSKAWMFMASGATFILIGCGVFAYEYKQGRLLDIEFASGTSVQFELINPMPVGEVRQQLSNNQTLPAVSVVSVGSDEKVYEVVTPNHDSRAVRDAILSAMAGKLNVTQPSTFDLANQPIEAAIDKVVVPIKAGEKIEGFVPPDSKNFAGGAAIVLKNLSPMLKPSDIAARIKNQQLTPTSGKDLTVASDVAVDGPAGNDDPTATAVVLVNDPNFSYDKGAPAWQDNLATPSWKLVGDAITKPAQLQKVSAFDASVAGDAERDAILALVMSVVIIMAYIWLRFGNLKYGTATVVAMLHDTFLVIGAVGLTHVIAGTWFGHVLLIDEGFRINLTLVAAILTVMSYSMIDTIVVFDRIRENRGKYGHLNRQVINDSINQTMSRTLLTAGTTVCTLMAMYFAGGPGIHGFTFVLLIGILVGTYSSIVIAAPILLLGSDDQPPSSGSTATRQLQKVGQ